MHLLELQGITKYFGGLPAVRNMDFSISRGEIVGLIGPNGAGKTTLFNVISGYFPPTSGEVIFKGENITGLKMHQVAQRGLVRTFQHSTLFSDLSVLDNMLIGFHLNAGIKFFGDIFDTTTSKTAKKKLERGAQDLLDLFDLAPAMHKPAGRLPHGHQRLLGVALALAAEPELLLLDEPVTGMNPEESKLMMKYIRNIRDRDITVLLVEHSMRVVMNVCERICVLSFGEKMAEGAPDDICRDKGVIEAYLGKEYAARN